MTTFSPNKLVATKLFVVALVSICIGSSAGVCYAQKSWASDMFSETTHDFKIVARGAKVSHRLTLENKYATEVKISNISTSCGCTLAKIVDDKKSLKSRETCELEIEIDTVRHMGEKNTHVTVTLVTDSGAQAPNTRGIPLVASVVVPIHVYIRRDIVIQPGHADFKNIEQGVGAEKELSIEYAGRGDWTIKGVESSDKNIVCKAVEKSRVGTEVKYDLKVSVKSTMPVGEFRSQVFLLTDDANSPKVPILVEGRIDPDVYVTNPVVSLGLLTPGQKKTVSVIVRSKKPISISKIESTTNNELFMTKLPGDQKKMHILPLTVTAPDKPGTLQEEFIVTITGRDEPIKFKAFGKITAK